MSGITNTGGVATKRAHGDEEDLKPKAHLPRFEVALLDEGRSESIFHLLSKEVDALSHVFNRMTPAALKALGETNPFFADQVRHHLNHKALTIAKDVMPVIQLFEDAGMIIHNKKFHIRSLEELIAPQEGKQISEVIVKRLQDWLDSIAGAKSSRESIRRMFSAYSEDPCQTQSLIKSDFSYTAANKALLQYLHKFYEIRTSFIQRDHLRANPQEFLKELLKPFFKVISNEMTPLTPLHKTDFLLFLLSEADSITALVFREDWNPLITQDLFEKLMKEVSSIEVSKISYEYILDILKCCQAKNVGERPFFQDRLHSFIKVLEEKGLPCSLKVLVYIEISSRYKIIPEDVESSGLFYLQKAFEEAVKIENIKEKATALTSVYVRNLGIASEEMNQQCLLEIQRMIAEESFEGELDPKKLLEKINLVIEEVPHEVKIEFLGALLEAYRRKSTFEPQIRSKSFFTFIHSIRLLLEGIEPSITFKNVRINKALALLEDHYSHYFRTRSACALM